MPVKSNLKEKEMQSDVLIERTEDLSHEQNNMFVFENFPLMIIQFEMFFNLSDNAVQMYKYTRLAPVQHSWRLLPQINRTEGLALNLHEPVSTILKENTIFYWSFLQFGLIIRN